MSDYKWVTESPEFAFTDDERWEITDTGDGFTLRQNLTWADPGGADPDWELINGEFATMADAMAYAGERQAETYRLFNWAHGNCDGTFTLFERLPKAVVYACGACGQHRAVQDDPAAHRKAMAALAGAIIDAADSMSGD